MQRPRESAQRQGQPSQQPVHAAEEVLEAFVATHPWVPTKGEVLVLGIPIGRSHELSQEPHDRSDHVITSEQLDVVVVPLKDDQFLR